MRKIPDRFYRHWFIGGLVCLLVLLSLGSCSTNQILIKDADGVFKQNDGLEAAFNQYWQLMARKEVKKAFTKEAPYVQEMVSEDRYVLYKKLFLKGELTGIKVLKVNCGKPFLCCIDCQMTYNVRGKSETRELRDCWVRVESGWYHVFRSPLFFPM